MRRESRESDNSCSVHNLPETSFVTTDTANTDSMDPNATSLSTTFEPTTYVPKTFESTIFYPTTEMGEPGKIQPKLLSCYCQHQTAQTLKTPHNSVLNQCALN